MGGVKKIPCVLIKKEKKGGRMKQINQINCFWSLRQNQNIFGEFGMKWLKSLPKSPQTLWSLWKYQINSKQPDKVQCYGHYCTMQKMSHILCLETQGSNSITAWAFLGTPTISVSARLEKGFLIDYLMPRVWQSTTVTEHPNVIPFLQKMAKVSWT